MRSPASRFTTHPGSAQTGPRNARVNARLMGMKVRTPGDSRTRAVWVPDVRPRLPTEE